ncbi:phosphopantetheine adenylyltransferase [Pyrobaculum aerophilum]|uniref:Phosphopantetheine adenylyltransferase n=1 Tax=Pyrobaculum aerophilum TaxID=13773 RepID=A0A371R6F1_9CREN|nr:phosphopantetheine adenylyltransferase [Pyrobaculum aerophilum]RFA97166.1 phosphopantetheine adenylyltransferase [Pyrobaculum aerophilum]RFB00065.1 phosphopantetheine adenylyltransferase [Pyrobaculum aerophilum]
MKYKFRNVVLGGTFDTLHSGHVKLLATATLIGDRILIGLTSDSFASTYKQYKVRPFSVRLANLRNLMSLIAPEREVAYVEIHDPYGPAVFDPRLEAIVASIETAPRALQINDERAKRGLRPMEVFIISTVRDGYGHTLSSTYIRNLLSMK